MFLSACAGGGLPQTPSGFASSASVSGHHATPLRVTALGVKPDAKCPVGDTACYTFSLGHGLTIVWCLGTASSPCSQTSSYSWAGGVCKKKTVPCTVLGGPGFINSIKAAWSGPYQCNVMICGTNTGTFEVDTLTAGKKPPQPTTKYIYKQDIEATNAVMKKQSFIGLNVSMT
jgi:hypothetical protein